MEMGVEVGGGGRKPAVVFFCRAGGETGALDMEEQRER